MREREAALSRLHFPKSSSTPRQADDLRKETLTQSFRYSQPTICTIDRNQRRHAAPTDPYASPTRSSLLSLHRHQPFLAPAFEAQLVRSLACFRDPTG